MARQKKFSNFSSRPKRDDGPQGLTVIVRGDTAFDFQKALRKFKRKVSDSGILQDLKDKSHYQKPSEKKREAKKRGIARARKERAMSEDYIPTNKKRKR